jgi:uracil-DNA glycosylase
VDPREQLRRYLEQRREMGESELVLDSLTVDEALRIVGAAVRASSSSAPADAPPIISKGDWRATLRAAGGAPTASEDRQKPVSRMPVLRGQGRADERADERGEEPSASPSRPSELLITPPSVSDKGDLRTAEPTPSSLPIDAPVGITVGSDARELFGGPLASLDSLDEIARVVRDCKRCPLYAAATNPVPGDGPSHANVMIVGEAPGANEDATGKAFVGQAGQLLTKILSAVELRREDVFICNVMKHRPPGNRNPTPDEVAACSPYLVRQIELIRPKVIIALGTFAAQTLLATKLSIGKLRGQIHRYHGVPLIVTYHPAALLRNPGWKRPTWEDVQLARRILDRASGA